MDKFKVDVPVALIFFNRPDTFEKVFDCVRRTKPSKLFLIQDGVRSNKPNDKHNIDKCREICSHIDWECEVYKDFSEVNLGCGRRIFSGLTNAFKIVDRLVIVEDDIAFNDSFLPFCAELLEKYKDDQRINQISGMNHFGVYEDCSHDYFFSRGGAIWGWATWKRVWDNLKWELPEADDEYIYQTLKRNGYYNNYGTYIANKSRHIRNIIKSGSSPSFWSFHFLYYSYLQNRINIVPKYNLISNIGLTGDTTHAVDSLKKLPRNTRKQFFARMYDLTFPLNHPDYVLDDRHYKRIQTDLMSPHGLKGLYYKAEYAIRRLIYG